MITFTIAADGAATAQVGSASFNGTSGLGNVYRIGTAAVDSAAAQTLTVTADWNSALTTNKITLGTAVLEKL